MAVPAVTGRQDVEDSETKATTKSRRGAAQWIKCRS